MKSPWTPSPVLLAISCIALAIAVILLSHEAVQINDRVEKLEQTP